MDAKKREAAACYRQTSSFQRNVGRKLISKLLVSQGAKILDLGCGTGELATELADLVGPEGKIVAVDPDADRIKLAKETNSRANIEFVVGSDATFPEGQYDIVFMNCVIHWINDKGALYKRVYDNLSPGGIFGFSTGKHHILPATKNFLNTVHPRFLEDVYLKWLKLVDLQVYKELQESTTFESHILETERNYVSFKTAEACLNWFFGVVQEISPVNKETTQSYDEEIQNNPMSFSTQYVVLKKTA